MEIIKAGRLDNSYYVRCERCGTEMRINANDLRWSHTEEKCYYVNCPIYGEIAWLEGNPTLDTMWASVHGKA